MNDERVSSSPWGQTAQQTRSKATGIIYYSASETKLIIQELYKKKLTYFFEADRDFLGFAARPDGISIVSRSNASLLQSSISIRGKLG
mgnify:CR=1 FL=1